MTCNQNCNQGRNCNCNPLPVQYAEPEPIGSDWVDMAMLTAAAAVLVLIGFVIGRAFG